MLLLLLLVLLLSSVADVLCCVVVVLFVVVLCCSYHEIFLGLFVGFSGDCLVRGDVRLWSDCGADGCCDEERGDGRLRVFFLC